MFKIIKNKLDQSDIGRRMASGAFWSFSGTALAKLFVLVSGILCARILGKTEYGEFGMIRSTINTFVIVGGAGLGITATKYISEFRNSNREKVSNICLLTNKFSLVTGSLVTFLVFIISPFLATYMLNAPELEKELKIGSFLLFVVSINSAQNGILSGFEKFKSIAINTLIGSLAESVFMLLGAFYWGISGAIVGYGCGFFIFYLANKISIKRTLFTYDINLNSSKINRECISILFQYSLPATLSSLMVGPVFWYVRSILVRNNGFDELAVFEAADHWKIIILFIPTAISQIVLPILSSVVNEDNRRFWKILKFNLLLNVSIALLMSIIIFISSSYIMKMYGDDYLDTSTIKILALSTIFTSAASVVGLSISSRAKMWVGFMFNIFWALMLITFSHIFLYYDMGASGIALAILISYLIHAILQLFYLKSII